MGKFGDVVSIEIILKVENSIEQKMVFFQYWTVVAKTHVNDLFTIEKDIGTDV